jgi:hypothetical protein
MGTDHYRSTVFAIITQTVGPSRYVSTFVLVLVLGYADKMHGKVLNILAHLTH